jgi:hypothetical protein
VKIQSASAHAAYSCLNISSHQKQYPANAMASSADSTATSADTVGISNAARNIFAAQSNSAATLGQGATALFDTDQGFKNLDIDAYFSPDTSTNWAASSLQSRPPLLLPNQNNIDALSNHISATFPQFLEQNNIPSAPSSITYDNQGQIQLPSDYAYASELKQALEDNPTVARELSTLHALTSHWVEIKKSSPFQQEYAAAATQAEINAVITKYSYLFSGNRHYDTIALQFSASGRLSLTHDGKPLS